MSEVEINSSNCNHKCEGCSVSNCGSRGLPPKYQTNSATNIKKLIAVTSGKGGVGKSSVTSTLACALRKQGLSVAIFDADITGPSIPKAFGVKDKPVASKDGLNPCESSSGIKMMSLNLLLDGDEMPVAWRGPVIGGVIKQFYEDVIWGDVDVMLIDMPPGTSDVFLTIMQMMPVDGIVTVSAPQELVHMIVGKAVNLAKEMNIEVIGLVENMAYFTCDECDKKHYIFGEPTAEAIAAKYQIGSFATLPLDPNLASFIDAGKVEEYEVSDELEKIVEAITK